LNTEEKATQEPQTDITDITERQTSQKDRQHRNTDRQRTQKDRQHRKANNTERQTSLEDRQHSHYRKTDITEKEKY
jgi:hypothetical protein